METPGRVKCVILILTAGCNLRCTYCYHGGRRSGVMPWDTVQAAVDLLLSSEPDRLQLMFLGGEPLLELTTLRRAIEYTEARRGKKHVRYTLSTNGSLLSPEVAAFLERAGVEVQISFDGVSPAQELRAPGSFPSLDGLLVRLRQERPALFRDKLRINLTLVPPTIPHLADSVDYFRARGCTDATVSPAITDWGDADDVLLERLETQFSRIYRACSRHFAQSGQVPISLFDSGRARRRRGTLCRAADGSNLSVDVDGRVFGCAVLARSVQDFHNPLLLALSDAMLVGDLHSPNLSGDYRRFVETAGSLAAFNRKGDKYSKRGRCRDCAYVADCTVCPASSGHIPANADPDRVSEFACAFNRVALSYAARFREEHDLRGPYDPDVIIARMERFLASWSHPQAEA